VLDAGGAAAVGAADRPAVGVDRALVRAAAEETRLDGDDQPRYEVQWRSLLGRPYDLRHAAVSLWLNSGVPATEVDRRGKASPSC
jgi:hypothetical protein